MLDKRTNVLLTSTQYKVLTTISKVQGVTLGELIRRAVDDSYINTFKKKRASEALKELNKINKGKAKLSDQTIIELVREGRR